MAFIPYGFYKSPAVAYDSDAQAFFTAVEGGGDSLTTTEKDAVNTLVVDLKADSIWSDILYVYPFVGGTASAHKWNLKDPQNTDAAYRLDFGTSITHSSNGIIGSAGGAQSFADTHYVASTAGATAHSIGMYFNQGMTANPNNWYDYGQYDGSNDNMISLGFSNKTTKYVSFRLTSYRTTTSGDYANGLFVGGNDGTDAFIQQDGTELLRSSQTFNAGTLSYYLLSNHRVNGAASSTGRGIGLAVGYDIGLSSSQGSDLNDAVVACMTTLGRN